MSTPTRDTAVSVSEGTFLRDNMVCHLDTVTYVSAEHGEKETVVEVCEPYVAPEPKDCTQSSQEREPESHGLHFPGIRQRYRSACLARKPPRFHYTVTTYNYK
mgnify:CR=1 FL=1